MRGKKPIDRSHITPLTIHQKYAILWLTRGKYAVIDASDWPLVATKGWHARPRSHGKWYASANIWRLGKSPYCLYLHRLIVAAPPGMEVDHRNNDGLNNRRSNLRICTTQQNRESKHIVLSRTGFKGVVFDSRMVNRPLSAVITMNRKPIRLGRFTDPVVAARAYDDAARKLFGEFAKTNFPDPGPAMDGGTAEGGMMSRPISTPVHTPPHASDPPAPIDRPSSPVPQG